ncbi:MAG: cysteine desulfurase NifS [Verrucomicrobia bacterium]|nr:MAG: cysteine desulfurase NifS [Verrucomicrobiota bacterium]PYJ33517.1 MAG: cysteine desulfurase NifS [Verrucomicrobiota bacterium]
MIYLDYNATTPLCDAAREAMLPYLGRHFGNPSSVHAAGRSARAAIDDARDKLAGLLRVKPHELIFTSGGTESCNLAVLGLARSRSSRAAHIISAKTEHHAVLNAVEHLEKHENVEVTWLNVARDGIVDLDQLAKSIRPETRLVSIMTANNETGVIQPMREISQICREHGVLLHTDMVQAFGKMPVVIPSEVEESRDAAASKLMPRDPSTPLRSAQDDGVDLSLVDAASFAAHKFYGPKGVGFLYLRSGLSIEPIMFGGAHENERRPGTENVAAIAAMAAAAEWTLRGRESEQERQAELRDDLWTRISQNIPDAKQNGQNAPRLANTLNVSLLGLDSEMLLIALDLEGVCASSGSACMVGSVVASHVLLAMGLPIKYARSAVRFSLGKWTTTDEIKAAGDAVRKIVDRLETRKSAYAVA